MLSKSTWESHPLNPMQKSDLQYNKSLLLYFQIERSLREFLWSKEKNEGNIRKVRANVEELLDRTERVVAGKEQEDDVQKLKKLFELLEIKKIRNTLAHPEKSFHHCYWYRIATLAADPAIERLGLHKVTQTLLALEDGKLIAIDSDIDRIPNNLPDNFDHTVTGLIGRDRELSELKDLIPRKKFPRIALVAPGGRGKTALLLQALREIVQSLKSTEWVDRILYFSSKTETLTAQGTMVQSTSLETIDGICAAIANTLAEQNGLDSLDFEQACQEFDEERILLCLDNLETLLINDPNTFNRFYRRLPDTWKVVVTSRIDVNNAETIALHPLDNKDSEKLAREYLLKRGGKHLDDEEIQNLVEACNYIPLTIRLTIDLLILSNTSLDECISHANEKILEFSFKNLVESLSLEAREVLECLFVTKPKPISRREATFLLDRDRDLIAIAFNQLRGTSLVTLNPNLTEENYVLSDSVRELLAFSPLNTQIRSKVEENLTRIQDFKKDEDEKVHPIFDKFIPASSPDHVRVLVSDAFKKLDRKSDLNSWREILKKIERTLQDYPEEAVLHRVRGMIRLKIDDRVEGIRSLQKAWEMNDIASGLLLSGELLKARRYTKAKDITESLVQLGWDNPKQSAHFLARLVIKNHCNVLIALGEIEQVNEYVQNRQDSQEEMQEIYSLMRVRALRHSVSEGYVFKNKIQGALLEAVKVLQQIFQSVGYARNCVNEGMQVVKVLANLVRNEHPFKDQTKLEFVNFIDLHLREMCEIHKEYKLDRVEVKTWLQDLSTLEIEGHDNPLISERWKHIIGVEIEPPPIISVLGEEWISVQVYYIPAPQQGKRRPFLFAEDASNKQYMVHRSNATSTLKKDWNEIKKGDRLTVVADTDFPNDDGKATKARKARRVKN